MTVSTLTHPGSVGHDKFGMMIFASLCRPKAKSIARRKKCRSWLIGADGKIMSFCRPFLESNVNGVNRLMRACALDQHREAIDFRQSGSAPAWSRSPDRCAASSTLPMLPENG